MNADGSLASQSQDRAAAEQLLLARLLVPAKRPPTPASVKTQLAPFFTHRLTSAEWNELFESARSSLADAGLVTTKPLALTDAGRRRALASLGMKQVPPRLNWGTLKSAWLTPLALEAPVEDSRGRDRLKSADGLKGYILKREYQLRTEEFPTLNKSLNALIWKQLGIETDRKISHAALVEEILGRILDPAGRLKQDQVQKQLPTKAIGASRTGVDELRLAAIRRWIEQGGVSSTAEQPQPPPDADSSAAANGSDLTLFAERVHATAKASVVGRFGPNKVFIGQVWRQLASEPSFREMNLDSFKSRLVEANRAGLVSLSRADLVEAMPPEDVASSETRHLNAVFHFVTLTSE